MYCADHTLFINCGGLKVDKFEEDSTPGGPSTFFSVGDSPRWAYSSTGSFLYDERANFVATETSNPNVTGIYRTARLAPISLKYYGLCLLPGSYHVTLHFAEIMFVDDRKFDSNGRRFFDVSIQVIQVLFSSLIYIFVSSIVLIFYVGCYRGK